MKKKKHLLQLSEEIKQRFKNELSEEDLMIISEFVKNFKPKATSLSTEALDSDIEKLAKTLFSKFDTGLDKFETNLVFYKVSDDIIKLPKRATPGSAGIDLFVNFIDLKNILCFDKNNNSFSEEIVKQPNSEHRSIVIKPGDRGLIPTGVTSTFSENYVALMYARSGNAFKRGINLINSVGVIDSDYRNAWFVPIFNNTDKNIIINDGDAIAQVIMTPISKQDPFYSSKKEFEIFLDQESNNERKGGFGSSDKV